MGDSVIIRNRIALSAKGAEVALAAAKAKAAEIGTPMCIAVVDAAGYLMAFARDDDARLANIQMALVKASSAVLRRRATADEAKLRPEDPLQTIRTVLAAGSDKVTTMNGGIPIVVEDELIGAVGVSGGSRAEDVPVAQAGVDAVVARLAQG